MSSPSALSEKLQDVECCKVSDGVAGWHNWNNSAVEAEKTEHVADGSQHTEHMLPKTAAVKECENLVNTEVQIEEKLDSLYSWVIVAASFVNSVIVGTMFIGFSILYVEISEYFGSSKGVAGFIGSLHMASGNVFGIVFSVFVIRYGCRIVTLIGGVIWFIGFASSSLAPNIIVLYLTYGIIAGMGFNMVTLTSFIIVQQHFKKFRALAAAIAASGLSFGTLISGPLLTAMLNAFQWRGTLLLMSAVVLNCCVFGALYRPPPTKSPQRAMGQAKTINSNATEGRNSVREMTLCETMQRLLKDLTNLSVFSNVPFTLDCIGSMLMNFGLMVFLHHTPSRAVFLGIDRRLAYLLPTVTGVALLVGRITGGVIGNLSCTNRLLQYGVSIVTGGLLLIVLGSLLSFISLAVFGAAAGFVTGCFLTIQSTVLSDLVGVENIARAQAFLLLFIGVGALVGIPLAGFIYDRTGNYSIPFYMGGAVEVLGGGLVIVAVILKHISA